MHLEMIEMIEMMWEYGRRGRSAIRTHVQDIMIIWYQLLHFINYRLQSVYIPFESQYGPGTRPLGHEVDQC